MAYVGNNEEVEETNDAYYDDGAEAPQRFRCNWSDYRITKLCNAIKQFPYMYDPDHPQFKDRSRRKETWVTIAELTGLVNDPTKIESYAKECERKYKNLRDEMIKNMRRVQSGKPNVPYRHAPHLTFLKLDNIAQRTHSYCDKLTNDGRHDYEDSDTMDAQAAKIDSAYPTAAPYHHTARDTGVYDDTDNGQEHTYHHNNHYGPPRIASIRSYGASPQKRTPVTSLLSGYQPSSLRSKRPAVGFYNQTSNGASAAGGSFYARTPNSGLRTMGGGGNANGSGGRGMQLTDTEDELEDFCNVMIKRLRRLPNECWGQAMSRLMDTLSNVEESAKRSAQVTASCQTDD